MLGLTTMYGKIKWSWAKNFTYMTWDIFFLLFKGFYVGFISIFFGQNLEILESLIIGFVKKNIFSSGDPSLMLCLVAENYVWRKQAEVVNLIFYVDSGPTWILNNERFKLHFVFQRPKLWKKILYCIHLDLWFCMNHWLN